MALPLIGGKFSAGPKLKVAGGLLLLWAVQSLYVWAVRGSMLTPQEWFNWWINMASGLLRWLDGAIRARATS